MRVEEFQYELLTRDGLLLGILDGVQAGGQLTGNVNAQIRWSGSLTYGGTITKNEWLRYRIRVSIIIDGVVQPLGVFVVRGGEETTTGDDHAITLDLYDKTFIPASDAVETTYTVPEGTNIATAVSTLLASTGETHITIDSATAMTRSAMVWDAGTTKIRIINDLLAATGYMALWCDAHGTYRLTPYTPPAERPIVYRFAPSMKAIHTPQWAREQDAKIPNKIICVSQESADAPAMTATAVNKDPTSPYSFQNQGVWVSEVHTGVEAATQAALNTAAQRYLATAVFSATVKRSMLLTPLELNSICLNDSGGREVIENLDMTLTPATLMQVTTREVK